MNRRSILTISGSELECEIVRYFGKDDNVYLIYSCNEIDDAGYVKLYASKIIDNRARIIDNDKEWTNVKEIIKEVVRNNRDGLASDIIDFDESNLDNIVLENNRMFKLQGNLVNLFSENKRINRPVYEETIIEDIVEEPIVSDIDYETLYNDSISNNKELERKITELEQELATYRDKLNRIIDTINS